MFQLCDDIFSHFSEGQLKKEFDQCITRLESTKKKFYNKTQTVHKRLKDFSGKSNMSEAEAYVKDLDDIQANLDDLFTEVSSKQISLCSYSYFNNAFSRVSRYLLFLKLFLGKLSQWDH